MAPYLRSRSLPLAPIALKDTVAPSLRSRSLPLAPIALQAAVPPCSKLPPRGARAAFRGPPPAGRGRPDVPGPHGAARRGAGPLDEVVEVDLLERRDHVVADELLDVRAAPALLDVALGGRAEVVVDAIRACANRRLSVAMLSR